MCLNFVRGGMTMKLWEDIKLLEDEIIGIRRDLHRIPELGLKEFKTTKYIRDALSGYEVEIRDIGMETGLCVLIRGGHPGKTIALRADIDALPMDEASGLDFASEHPGVCHSCGHDIHAAMALSAARYLSKHRDELYGNVWIYFQPAEETLWGSKKMIEAGCLELEPKPESILMMHTYTPLESGRFGVIKGPANASSDTLRITVKSGGGHGAYPHRCGDTLYAAGSLLTQLQAAISRDNNCMMPAVLTFGSIHGGTASNVIPTEVVLLGTLRTLYSESRETIKASIKRMSENICAAFRTECTVEFLQPDVACLQNDSGIIDRAEAAIRKLFGDETIYQIPAPNPGSEDFANYLEHIPGATVRLGTQNPDDPQTALGQHAAAVRFDEGSLCRGVAFLCQYVADYLK